MQPQYPSYNPPNQQQYIPDPNMQQQYYGQPQMPIQQQQYQSQQQYYPPQQQAYYPQPQPQYSPQPEQQYYSQQPPTYPQQPSYPQPQQPSYPQTPQVSYPQLQQPTSYTQQQPSYPQIQPSYPQSQQQSYPQQQYYPQQQQQYYPQSQPQQQYYPQQQQYYPQAQPQQPYYPQQPQVYYPYVFNPTQFTDANNPWTASMWLQSYTVPATPQPQASQDLFKFQSVEQFQKLRQHATVDSAIRQLSEIGTDLSTVDPNRFIPDQISCFILCNSYKNPKYVLGVGPINDAITVAANHKYMGYKVYYLHDPQPSLFLSFLKVFLKNVNQYLTIFFSGHGAQIKDTSGDEADGYDEVMVFDNGYIVDDELARYLNKYSKGLAHTILLSDCCHSGTIWDIPEKLRNAEKFPANIMSISASNDSQTAKQTKIQKSSQGIFTFNLWTVVRNNPSIRIGDVQKIMNPQLRKFNQQLEYYPTRREMLDRPIFPLMSRR